MHLALYVGNSLQRADLITFAAPLITTLAQRLTLIARADEAAMLDDAIGHFQPSPAIHIRRWSQEHSFAAAILTAVQAEQPDLVIVPAFTARATPMNWPRRQLEFTMLGSLPIPFLRVQGRISPIRRIVIASAGGKQSLGCVPLVSQLARACQAEVTILHVASQEPVYFDSFTQQSPLDESIASVLQQLAATFNDLGVRTRLQVARGLVEDTVLAECKYHDVLVIGSHQVTFDDQTPTESWLRALQRLSLQDVTRDLLDRSPIPVLVIQRQQSL
ncbi:universal stress protein [uncultured Chloroflexus sp.]|uniref:universal stress protein n=1 Tax=uncultured Chloroflexus sp. TaxID=214040 RepID=UPI002626FBE0|nr:universal stress protein [uncultured Chloroflexus sp.]